MDIKDLIAEIEKLPEERQMELLSLLSSKLKKKENLAKSIDEIRGIGKGIWNMDAQEYVNKQRADERF